MAKKHRIQVTYDASANELTVDPTRLEIPKKASPIHSVVWDFVGVDRKVSEGWLPHLEFFHLQRGARTPYSGPFIALCGTGLCIGTRIFGCGFTGVRGEYGYRAVLVAPSPSLRNIYSQTAHLDSKVHKRKEKVIQVCRSDDDDQKLEIWPRDVTLIAGQPMEWRVDEALLAVGKWYPRLLFSSDPYLPYHPFLGPFASLEVTDQAIVATGSGSQAGKYNYKVQMISREDGTVQLESSPDPTIDDEGDPPVGGGEGGL